MQKTSTFLAEIDRRISKHADLYNQLRDEMKAIAGRANKVQEELQALTKIRDLESGESEPSKPRRLIYSGVTKDVSIHRRHYTTEPDWDDVGLRDAIRYTLHFVDDPMRPKDVTKFLRGRGFDIDGKTDLSLRVPNELYKMARVGMLMKVPGSRYALPPSQEITHVR